MDASQARPGSAISRTSNWIEVDLGRPGIRDVRNAGFERFEVYSPAGARVSLGAVAARVLLVQEAAQAIIGSRLDEAAQRRLEAAARAACRPIDDKRGTIEFRTDVAAVLARRTALIALDRARTS